MAIEIEGVLPAGLTTEYLVNHGAPQSEGSPSIMLTRHETDGVLELAHLTTAVDDQFTAEETRAFATLITRLLGEKASVEAVVRELEKRRTEEGLEGRLAGAVKKLARREAAELAYKISFALSMVDLATDDDEADFDAGVVAALGIGEERAQELANEVFEALSPDE
jgi:hypothetical protein